MFRWIKDYFSLESKLERAKNKYRALQSEYDKTVLREIREQHKNWSNPEILTDGPQGVAKQEKIAKKHSPKHKFPVKNKPYNSPKNYSSKITD